jgi:glycosyltransferase involved in cell wall biosynthesis
MHSGTKSRRVALLFEYATLNGGERSMLACLDCWKSQGTGPEIVAIAPGTGRLAEALHSRGIEVIPWNSSSNGSSGSSRDEREHVLREIVQQIKPDLLHANSLAMGRWTGRIANQLPIPTSSHLRDIVNLSQAAMDDLNRNGRLIAVSQATRDMHVARGLDPDRVIVIPNGLDLERFQPRAASGWLHRELNLPPSAILVATIGQIGLRKGQDILAAAAPAILNSHPDVHFLLIGERMSTKAESIQFEQSLQDRFEASHIGSHLHRLGYRDEIPQILAELTLVIHPAHQEPYGRVLLEAAALGVPVVATRVGGTAEIVMDGITGRLVPARDPESLAAAVIHLLNDSEQRQSMRIAARDRALLEFPVSRSADRLWEQWRTWIDRCDENATVS